MSGEIIVNADVLLPTYMPEKLMHREKELAQLKRNLQNFVNTFITGPCGSGKTTLAKKALQCIGNSKKAYACYIDCTVYQTTYSILKEIVPRSEFIFYRSNYELIKELMKQARERKFVVCLDNFEIMKDYELIAKFLSMGICLVLVSDAEESFSLLTENVRSNIPSIMRLQGYSSEQTFEILKDRADKALARWSCTDAVLKKIADSVKGNIALAINALRVAALAAEGKGKKAVEEADIPEIEDCPPKLSADEKML
ncbi:MAG: NB-ARC domain-containing protein, partial [candidate division WOR-3 bacterium]